AEAEAFRSLHPALCVDVGMQRFACPPAEVDAAFRAGEIREAFVHATRVDEARRLQEIIGERNFRLGAAATALLQEPRAWLDRVRPGLALYVNAVRVTAKLVDVRESNGPIGYTGFRARRHGVILVGYSNGLRKGPASVNGIRTTLRE